VSSSVAVGFDAPIDHPVDVGDVWYSPVVARLGANVRQLASYAAVAIAGVLSLATSYGDHERVSLGDTVVVPKNGAFRRHFRVHSNAGSTTIDAEITPQRTAGGTVHVALVPDQPALFATEAAQETIALSVGTTRVVRLGEPPCALAPAGCADRTAAAASNYGFTLTIDDAGTEATLAYEVVLSTKLGTNADDYGLELTAE
jgi:hypothetical protein